MVLIFVKYHDYDHTWRDMVSWYLYGMVVYLVIFFFNQIEFFSFNLFLYQIRAVGQFNILILISDGNSEIGAPLQSESVI